MTKLYQEVSLNCDFPEYNLKKGDLAILVDTIPHPTRGEEGYVLEIFDTEGESIDVVIVPKSAIATEKKEVSRLG
ncbi:DUF4926 domain-containing protein [Crocosphaera sp. XPORK-15E]|uniref:DUF4926 domain-containing protein n=1 Tax=Crocosphaera sp. XPORK-15E TaxID=3110247 RepID=UPI002B219946|nr:DUF4926 domain-containing protein [Crocosphaera sp. XPORK-15E]MEA5532628.1 DUF4926 domain-containing protein [Crocosphaera sp. XPORK-15E]